MPRVTKLTPEVQQRIVDALRAGAHRVDAAAYGGIGEKTFYTWLTEGDKDDDSDGVPTLDKLNIVDLRKLAAAHEIPYPRKTTKPALIELLREHNVGSRDLYRQFRQAVEEAEIAAKIGIEADLLTTLRVERDPQGVITRYPNPHAMLTFLARRWPKQWSPTQIVELSGPDGAPIGVNVTVEESLARNVNAYLQGIDDAAVEHEEAE